MRKNTSMAFGQFLSIIRSKEAQREGKKMTTMDMAKKVGISQAHWYRAEKNGYILGEDKVWQIINHLRIDPVMAKILLAHAGYSNRNITLLDRVSESLADTQSIIMELFYNSQQTGIIKSVALSWVDPELEIPEYTRYLCRHWGEIEEGFSQQEIERFVEARKHRQEEYSKSRIASQFVIVETIFEKSVLVPPRIICKQIEHIIKFMEEQRFLEVRLLQPGPKCPHPMTNFRLYSHRYLWLGYMYYGEIVCGEIQPELIKHFDKFFYEYWNKALSKEKSIKRLKEIARKFR